jgi:hypothetical protein
MGGKSSPPASPDYTGAANATSSGNLQQAQYTTKANRVNQYGPNGSLVYSQENPNDPNSQWSATQTLSPDQQKLQDMQNSMSLQYGGLGQQAIDTARGLFSNPTIDESKLAQMPQNAGQTTQDAMMARLQPQTDRENQQSDAQLANQGITQGSEAYNNAKTQLGQTQNDRFNQAALAGVTTDMQARNQGIANQSAMMNQPLNMINALRTGSQVTGQNYVNPAQQQGVAGADYLGAASAQGTYDQGIYNAQQGSQNGMNSGLFGLGSAAIGKWSDRRLKKNIERIGTHALGIGLYVFEYIWGGEKEFGVMADEVIKVIPEAVILQPNGYYKVDYSMLGAI